MSINNINIWLLHHLNVFIILIQQRSESLQPLHHVPSLDPCALPDLTSLVDLWLRQILLLPDSSRQTETTHWLNH